MQRVNHKISTTETIAEPEKVSVLSEKLKGFLALCKFRLSLLVAISAVFGYAMAGGATVSFFHLLMIGVGGLLITGASNALNQVFEREHDKKMNRTQNRPMPTGVLSNVEGIAFAALMTLAGVSILGYYFNLASALLGIIGLLSYAFVYTPMKRMSTASVFVGAIPGALPPLIGWVAFTGALGTGGLVLMAFQFFWQFPHFWAIAWCLDEDYKKAGFKMLPSSTGKSRFSAMLILIYSLCLAPLAFFAWQSQMVGLGGVAGLVLLGLLYSIPAIKLYKSLDGKFAKQLMFASFLYLPAMQIVFLTL